MKRIINGVTYNTATAVKIAYSSKKYDDGKYVTMYQTRKGAFFFHLQNYARAEGHLQDWYNEDDVKNPKDFFERADKVYINPFSSVEAEMQRETAIFVRLPEPLKRALEAAAKEQNVSVNHLAVRCLEGCLLAKLQPTT